MVRFSVNARRMAFIALLPVALLVAQDEWKTLTQLPAVDLTGLTAAQKTRTLRLLRNHSCPCWRPHEGCGMPL